MEATIRFRFNTLTGEVEAFEVEQTSTLPSADHERAHDQLAAEVGAVLERHPRVVSLPNTAADQAAQTNTNRTEADIASTAESAHEATTARRVTAQRRGTDE